MKKFATQVSHQIIVKFSVSSSNSLSICKSKVSYFCKSSLFSLGSNCVKNGYQPIL